VKKNQPKVGMLVENLYQEMEVWYPIFRLQEAGALVTVIGPKAIQYSSKLGYPVIAEISADQANPKDFDVLIIPGGFAPDLMRVCKPMISLTKEAHERGVLIASICHGTWLLISANIIENQRVTGAPSIIDDITNAGGKYVDAEVVVDKNIISSRKPADIPAFSRAIMTYLSSKFGNEPW
jgi:protease I